MVQLEPRFRSLYRPDLALHPHRFRIQGDLQSGPAVRFPLEGNEMTELLQLLLGEFHTKMLLVLLSATQWTIYLSLTAFIGGGLIGLLFTVLKICPIGWLRRLATAYIWLFQAIPLLMLLFLTGLVPAFFKNASLVGGDGVVNAIYQRLHVRSMAGALNPCLRANGKAVAPLAWGSTILYSIVAPQALRIATPPTVGFMVQVIKGTSMAYIIDYNDKEDR